MGLYDANTGFVDPVAAGLLSAGFSGLQASGPSMMPTSLGQVIGGAGNAGLGSFMGTLRANQQYGQGQALIGLEQMKGELLKQQVAQAARQMALQEAGARMLGFNIPGTGPALGGPQTSMPLGSPALATGPMPALSGATASPSMGLPPSLQPAAAADLAFNGGKGIGQIIAEAGKGAALRPNAPLVNQYTGQVIAQPTPVPGPGMTLTLGHNGPAVAPTTGYPEARGYLGQLENTLAADRVAREKAAGAPYEFQSLTNASGATVPVSVADLIRWRAPQGGISVPNSSLPQNAQGAITAIPANEVPQARAAGISVTGDPWATMPRRLIPQGIGQTTFDRETAGKQAEAGAKLAETFGTKSTEATQRKALNEQALQLVDQSDTGPMAASIAEVKNWLVSRAGVPESDFANTPTATIALQKDLVNAATQKAKQQFGSRITQSEVNLMLSRGAPNVDMTKAAIKYLIGTDIAQSDYQIKQANDLGKYLSSGGDPYRFEAWYSDKFPMKFHDLPSAKPVSTARPSLSSFNR